MDQTVEVVVGVIGRAHGLRGETAIDVRTDEPERRFAPGSVLTSEDGSGTFTVATRREHSGRLLVSFVELPDRSAVERVRGTRLTVAVPAAETPDDEDEYYDRQLIGLDVEVASGERVGRVAAVVHLPTQDLLEIDTTGGARLVPFVEALVPVVDLEAGTLRLADLPGLLTGEAEE